MTDESDRRPIHVALTFDDNFWAPAYALMRSICLTSARRRDFVFHLCHDHLSAGHRADLERITSEFGAKLLHYPLETNDQFNALCRSLPVDKRLHVVIYARLLLDHLLPAEVERVIYLDCDTMVYTPLERLFEMDLEGHPIAAAPDSLRLKNMMDRDMAGKGGVFDPSSAYFNSGVLLIDRRRYAETDVPARLREMQERGIIAHLYFDQDMLNLIFADNWKKLEWRWNVIDPRSAHQTMDPYILHYTGNRRPWNLVSAVAFANTYRHVMTNELFYRYMRHRAKRRWTRRLKRLIGRK